MTSPHRYGPHSPENAPNAVTVLGPSVHSCGWTNGHAPDCVVTRYPVPEVRPIPAALVEQREQLNTRAHLLAMERWGWPCVCGIWHAHDELCPDGGWIT